MLHKKLSVSPAPDAADLSAFALIAYQDNPPPIPEGYVLLCDCPESMQKDDYFGQAYYHQDLNTGVVDVVITHRGTVLSAKNVVDDLRILCGNVPKAWETGSKPFTDLVAQEINKKFPKSSICYTHTGHSLGTIHADLCFAYQAQNQKNMNALQSVTFENPGSIPMIEDLINDKTFAADTIEKVSAQSFIYNADVDVINTCNKQLGKNIYSCKVGYEFEETDEPPMEKKYYATQYSVDQHHMVKMYNLLNGVDPSSFIKKMENWPAGLKAGFNYYLLYSNHSDYWDLALQNYWNNSEDIQNEYDNNYADYKEDMINKYLSGKSALVHESNFLYSTMFPMETRDGFVIVRNNNKEVSSKESGCANDSVQNKSGCIII